MTRLGLVLLTVLASAACSGGSSSNTIPPGTWSGSTADDREFVIEVTDEVEVNRREARYVERGVLEVRQDPFRITITCDLHEDEEELRCDVSTTAPGLSTPMTEVIDLMLL